MWYEQSLANRDQVELEAGTLAVDGNQAACVLRMTSAPWTQLGLAALEAHTELVLVDGRIMTHVAVLTPEAVRALQAARDGSGSAWAVPPWQAQPGQPY